MGDGQPGSEFATLARERAALLMRLDPRAYFDRGADFADAVRDAEAWWQRFLDAYGAHFRRVSAMAVGLPAKLVAALTVADLLRTLNGSPRRGAPVGEEALIRLEDAVEEIRLLSLAPESVPTRGVILGRVPTAFAEARLAAAAVLAAIDVHRRRARP